MCIHERHCVVKFSAAGEIVLGAQTGSIRMHVLSWFADHNLYFPVQGHVFSPPCLSSGVWVTIKHISVQMSQMSHMSFVPRSCEPDNLYA